MPCPTSGNDEVLRYAREAITSAQTIEQLRQAQAVVLPLNHGLSLTDTARIIGVSPGWACQLRRRFMHGQMAGAPGGPHCRRVQAPEHAPARGTKVFSAFFASTAEGGLLVIGQIKAALDQCLGRTVALVSVYKLLHRHGWMPRHVDARIYLHPWRSGCLYGCAR